PPSSNTSFPLHLLSLSTMKTFAYAAAATVACLATQSSAYSDTACPISETVKLLALGDDQYLDSCQTASGYTFVPPSAYPTESQILLMCLTPDCHSLIADLLALEPADCVINFGTVSINVLELAESFTPNCTALGL
ncbi:hypothetical protein F444_19256, partial [Phytophthora nicotianae P1976]